MSDPREKFRQIELRLWRAASSIHHDYQRGQYDGWVLCPRAHAKAHLRCILELSPPDLQLPGDLQFAREQFSQVNRFFDGEDLVFAVGDVQ